MWPSKPGSTNPAVEWISSPSRPRLDLPSSRATRSSAERHALVASSPSTNSPGWSMNTPSSGTSISSVSSLWSSFTSIDAGACGCGTPGTADRCGGRPRHGWTFASSIGSITMRPGGAAPHGSSGRTGSWRRRRYRCADRHAGRAAATAARGARRASGTGWPQRAMPCLDPGDQLPRAP